MNLKDRLTTAMEKKGCDIPSLAKAAKVKTPSVHGWLNESSKSLKAGPAIRAAYFLGVNPLWLAEGEGEMEPSSSYALAETTTIHFAKEPEPRPPLEVELLTHTKKMNDRGLILLIDQAEQIAQRHPKEKKEAA